MEGSSRAQQPPAGARRPPGARQAAADHGATRATHSTGATGATPGGLRLDRDAAERVLRRAVELSEDEAHADGDDFALDALLEAARDLGMGPEVVQRAVAEEQAGLLSGGTGPADRVVGPAVVSAVRVVPARPDDVLEVADQWLRRVWSFRRVRVAGTVAEYRRRTDPAAAFQRAARSVSGKEQLDKVRRLRLLAHPVDESTTMVALVVDLSGSRTAAEAGGATVAAAGSLGAAAMGMGWVPWAWLGVPISVAAGVGVMATRRAWTHGIDIELEALLDRVVAGERPPSVIGDLTDRLLPPRPPSR